MFQKTSVCTANNDILIFLISLGESGAESGLGMSVKGKTSVSDGCYRDFGLYVKSILDGGAAVKVSLRYYVCYDLGEKIYNNIYSLAYLYLIR